MKVWKYQLPKQNNELMVPSGATALCVQNQFDTPVIYFEVQPSQPKITRRVWLYPTGEEFHKSANAVYMGTITVNGFIVLHCYVSP